jgi:hypothetical protein
MVHGMDLSNRGPLTAEPFSIRPYQSDLEWLRLEARRQGLSVAGLVRFIIAKHVDAQPRRR